MRDSVAATGGVTGSSQHLSNYEKVTQIITTDPRCQKEASLGKRVGYYRLHGELGSGNFSEVKLAVHSLIREKVAVKIVDKTKLDQKTRRLLSREISSMESVAHPNIVRLYEVVETLAKLHMIMEYANGGELFTKVTTEGKLTEGEAKVVFGQVTSALQHMHDNNIIHRDLKAENVFYAAPSYVKVGDFGFSTMSTLGNPLNTFCGSPPYAAPELFQDDFYEGRYVDVWALGVLLYFIITGLMPFRAETVGKLKKCILNNPVNVPSFVPRACQDTIVKVLCKSPRGRLSLDAIAKCDWLDGCSLPQPLEKFEMDPCRALTLSASSRGVGDDEKQALSILKRHGVTSSIIRGEAGVPGGPADEEGKATVKSHVTGIYRITLHKLQQRAGNQSGKTGTMDSNKSIHSSFSSSRKSGRGFNGATSSMTSDSQQNKQSRLCTIL